MTDTHVTIDNVEGDAKRRWHTAETYKVSDTVAKEFDAQKGKLSGEALQSWVKDHGGVLDDGNGKPGRVSTKNDGTVLNDHYKDGEFQKSDVVNPPGAKNDHAGAQLLLAVLTGGTSLFVAPFVQAAQEENGSKFTSTTPAAEPAAPTATDAKATKVTATATVKPKP